MEDCCAALGAWWPGTNRIRNHDRSAGRSSGDRYDQDRTDEAAQLIAAIGGNFHSGDVAEVETADPAFWEANEFTLNYEVGAVGRAEIPDAAGQFSFTLALLAPDQSASILFVEGDQPQSALAYLGIQGSDEPRGGADPLPRRLPPTHCGGGSATTWRRTASARGRPSPPGPRARSGSSRASPTLVARAALTPVGTSYSDCSFYYGPSLAEAPWMLRLVEIGGYPDSISVRNTPH